MKPEKPVLRDVSLHASPGQTIALVGPTGAGKTTIISLLSRFYDVDQGTITIDGRDIRSVRQKSIRRQLGIVSARYLPLFRHRDGQHPLRPS